MLLKFVPRVLEPSSLELSLLCLGAMSSTKKKKTQRWCFVPGCDAGYKSCGVKLSLFRAPKDAATFEKWARAIPRADKVLQENSAVCERHFDDRLVFLNSIKII